MVGLVHLGGDEPGGAGDLKQRGQLGILLGMQLLFQLVEQGTELCILRDIPGKLEGDKASGLRRALKPVPTVEQAVCEPGVGYCFTNIVGIEHVLGCIGLGAFPFFMDKAYAGIL